MSNNTEENKISKLFIECNRKDKAKWIRAANAHKMKLEAWVNMVLNESVEGNPDYLSPADKKQIQGEL